MCLAPKLVRQVLHPDLIKQPREPNCSCTQPQVNPGVALHRTLDTPEKVVRKERRFAALAVIFPGRTAKEKK